jgi:7-cyano-7-deazaguanine synthase
VKVIQILSGGMDSATLLYWHLRQGHDVRCISFDYGQRHRRELASAASLCDGVRVPWHMIEVHGLRSLLRGSSLTDASVDTPHGHYAAENMKQTVVPSRNAIMLSMAFGVAVAHDANAVSIGVHAGDHAIYPDCRKPFIQALEEALNLGTWRDGDKRIEIFTPFLYEDKGYICRRGTELGVPWELTWTCYEGGRHPCGKCGACQERAEAFAAAGVKDPLV